MRRLPASRLAWFWLTPIMGFCLLSLFAVLAIYLPELFPTRLRSTGVSFCYNVGRFVAALGPWTFGFLTSSVFSKDNGYGSVDGDEQIEGAMDVSWPLRCTGLHVADLQQTCIALRTMLVKDGIAYLQAGVSSRNSCWLHWC